MSRRAVDAQPVVREQIRRVSVAFIVMLNVARTFPPSGRYRDALDAPELGLWLQMECLIQTRLASSSRGTFGVEFAVQL